MFLRAAIHAVAFVGGILILCRGAASEVVEIPWKIDEPAARILAMEAVGHGAIPGDFDYDSNLSPSFFVFDGISPPPAEGSFGYFAVNPWTGDVWALWGCNKLATPALRKSQAASRQRFTNDELKQYARLRRLKPECIVERPEKP